MISDWLKQITDHMTKYWPLIGQYLQGEGGEDIRGAPGHGGDPGVHTVRVPLQDDHARGPLQSGGCR